MSTTALPAARTPLPVKRLTSWERWGRVLVLPYIAVFLVFVLYPLGYGLWLARHPESYVRLFDDPIFFRTAVNSLVFLLVAINVKMVLALALSGFFGQLAITKAFSTGKASVVAPFEYSALAWGVAIDWLLWQTLPDGYTLLGAGIIIASGIYLVRREAVHVEAEHP